jgi:uncharacterized protein (TIGR02118 family)
MVKLVYCLRRRADVPPEAFHRYWLEVHGPKVKSVAAALRARRYVQSHTVEPALNEAFVASRGLAPPYDGITEVWWDAVEDIHAAMASPAGVTAMKMLVEDEARFIDFAASRVFMTTEHPIFGP